MKRQEIVNAARSYIGLRWVHMGRDRFNGVDCAGLLALLCQDFGVEYYDHFGTYDLLSDGETLEKTLGKTFVLSDSLSFGLGDVFVFGIETLAPKDRANEYPQHIGIISDIREKRNKMIHSCNKRSIMKTVETPIPPKWVRDACAVFRFPGVED